MEIEVPTEHLHEQIHHAAEHSGEKWITWVALSTAVLAALAAVAALLAGFHANMAVIDRVKEANKYSYYQSNSIKSALVTSKIDLATLLDKPVAKKDQAKVDKYEGLKKKLQPVAEAYHEAATEHFEKHEWLAYSVTMFQVAIAIAAIAALTKMRPMWYMSLVFGLGGTALLIYAFTLHLTPEPKEEEGESSGEQQKEPKEKGTEAKEGKEPESEKSSGDSSRENDAKTPKTESGEKNSKKTDDAKESKDASKSGAHSVNPQASWLAAALAVGPIGSTAASTVERNSLAPIASLSSHPAPLAPC